MDFIKNFIKRMFTSKVYLVSVLILVIFIILALCAPYLPFDLAEYDVTNMSKGPSLQHIFGTDELGRDYFIRVLYGLRISLLVGFLAMITSTIIGTVIGLVAGYYGGFVDNLLMRSVDVLSSIPWLVLVIVLSVFLKPGLSTIIIVIGGFSWMTIARMIRGEALAAKEREYVIYAKFINLSSFKVIIRHILPAVLPTLIVAATTSISNAIMTESALSFLGLGIQQPMTSLGSLLQNAQSKLQSAPYMAVIPGLLVVMIVYSFNNIGNMIQELLLKED